MFKEEKLRTDTNAGANCAACDQLLLLALRSSARARTHARTLPTHIFSPFRLFSEVARPLSKVRVAKGRVHFHIFPFDMRRPSIQGYVFSSAASCLSLFPLRSFLHPLVPLLYTLRACLGGSWEDVTQTITEQLPGRETLAFARVCVFLLMQDCRAAKKKSL